MFPYRSITEREEREMLQDLGMESCEDLYAEIPAEIPRVDHLNLEKGMSEAEVRKRLRELASENQTTEDLTCFVGLGAYDHEIPSVVDALSSRSEFYTSYTPYQAEVSQGTLQAIFEFQTLIARLTGMDVANASLYDGGTACAEALFLCVNQSRKDKVLISKSVHPMARQICQTYLPKQEIEIEWIDLEDGVTSREDLQKKLTDDVGCVLLESPNALGFLEPIEEFAELIHEKKKTYLIQKTNPLVLPLLKKPGQVGVDVCVGEGQPLGIPLQYGGPYLGFMATKKKWMRKLPGRLVGQTLDAKGEKAYVLTLAAREQHIRREKATSNICSNQGLNALRATIYMEALGKAGMREVASLCLQKAHYLYDRIAELPGVEVLGQPFFHEFTVRVQDAEGLFEGLLDKGFFAAYPLERLDPAWKGLVSFTVTEKRTREEMDALVSEMEGLL